MAGMGMREMGGDEVEVGNEVQDFIRPWASF